MAVGQAHGVRSRSASFATNTQLVARLRTKRSLPAAAELGRKIGASWQKATAHVLETAELCDVAFRRHSLWGLPTVLRAAQMSRSTFMKLVVIGRDQRLRRIETLLPPSYSIIYQVSLLSDALLAEAVNAGAIHPHVRRTEIEALRQPSTNKDNGTKQDPEPPAVIKELAAGGRYELIFPTDIRADHTAQVGQILHGLQTKFGIQIVSFKALEAGPTGPRPP